MVIAGKWYAFGDHISDGVINLLLELFTVGTNLFKRDNSGYRNTLPMFNTKSFI